MAHRMRCGKGYELAVFGLLTLADFDVYAPLVDDQGIDGIIRIEGENASHYFELQVKGGKTWSSIRCDTAALRTNSVLILFCDKTKEVFWFLRDEAVACFPEVASEWGNVFLKADQVRQYKDEGRCDLGRLLHALETTGAVST